MGASLWFWTKKGLAGRLPVSPFLVFSSERQLDGEVMPPLPCGVPISKHFPESIARGTLPPVRWPFSMCCKHQSHVEVIWTGDSILLTSSVVFTLATSQHFTMCLEGRIFEDLCQLHIPCFFQILMIDIRMYNLQDRRAGLIKNHWFLLIRFRLNTT